VLYIYMLYKFIYSHNYQESYYPQSSYNILDGYTFFSMNDYPPSFIFGIIIGLSVGICILMFCISIYYGSLSNCNANNYNIQLKEQQQTNNMISSSLKTPYYVCDSKLSMWIVYHISRLLFYINCIIICLLYYGRNQLMNNGDHIDTGVSVSRNNGFHGGYNDIDIASEEYGEELQLQQHTQQQQEQYHHQKKQQKIAT